MIPKGPQGLTKPKSRSQLSKKCDSPEGKKQADGTGAVAVKTDILIPV